MGKGNLVEAEENLKERRRESENEIERLHESQGAGNREDRPEEPNDDTPTGGTRHTE